MATPGALFRGLLRDAALRGSPLQIGGAPSAYCAQMAQRLGFKALYLSGGGVALSSLGLPDLAVSTLSDVVEESRRITRVVPATRAPLLVDIDTGFGGALSVERAVRDLEAVGVAAVHIEDQVAVKRCGHRPNKQVVSVGEMCARISAATRARTDPDFVVMARTDALACEDLAAAVARCKSYVDAGADAIFPEAVTQLEQYRAFTEALPGVPVLANMTEFGQTPLCTTEELQSVGVSMALYPLSAFRAMSRAAEAAYARILATRGNASAVELMHTREQTYAVIDYHAHEARVDAAAREADRRDNAPRS